MVRSLINALLDVIFPITCVICTRTGSDCCRTCLPHLLQQCTTHRELLDDIGELTACSTIKAGSPLFRLIYRLKYECSSEVMRTLRHFLHKLTLPYIQKNTVLIPVPLHRTRLAWRGFNQSLLIAQSIAEKEHYQIAEILTRHRPTQPQVTLARAERAINIADAFCLRARVKLEPHLNYILVDDVVTTGATLRACAATLRKSGARHIAAVTIGRAP